MKPPVVDTHAPLGDRLVRHLLASPLSDRPDSDDVATWWPRHVAEAARWQTPYDRAAAAAVHADRVGWAFVSGYQAAGRVLAPELPAEHVFALCVTEDEGAHPRAIRTRLDRDGAGWRLTGTKRWTTLGDAATTLFVAATTGRDEAGRNRLRVARVDAAAGGVAITRLPPTPFVPEVPHAAVAFEGVALAGEDVLPGDGYTDVVKPFRTIEDLHVYGALLSYLVGVARRRGWPPPIIAELVHLVVAGRALAAAAPLAPETHVALAGWLGAAGRLIAACEPHWSGVDAGEAARWRRDAPLLQVAGKARAARFERAWAALTRA